MGIIRTNNVENAKKQIRKEPEPIIILGQEDDFNRKIIEHGKFDVLLSPEKGKRRDGLKYMDSGVNGVVARIAARNNIALGIDLKELRTLDKKSKAVRLARIKQNIKICRKAKTRIKSIGGLDLKNIFSLLVSLGASSKQAKEAANL